MNKIVSSTGNGTVSAGPDPDLRTASSCVGQVCVMLRGRGIINAKKKREYDDQKLYEKKKMAIGKV